MAICCCCLPPAVNELTVLTIKDDYTSQRRLSAYHVNEKHIGGRSKWGWKSPTMAQPESSSILKQETLRVYSSLNSLFVCEIEDELEALEEEHSSKSSDTIQPQQDQPVPNNPTRPPAPRHRSTRFSVNSAPSQIRNLSSDEYRASIDKYSESHTEILGVHTLNNRPETYLREQKSESSTQLTDTNSSADMDQDLAAKFNIVVDSPKTFEPRPHVTVTERIDLVPWLPGHEDFNRWSISPLEHEDVAFTRESIHEPKPNTRVNDWSQHVAGNTNQDNLGKDLCFMLMHDSEERVPKKAYFQRFVGWMAREEEIRPNADKETKRCSWRQPWFWPKGNSTELGSVEIDRLRTQGKYVLGDARWLKLEKGYKIWTTFGMVQHGLNKFEMHMLYMDDTTACLKLARLQTTKGKPFRSYHQRRNNGPVWEKRSTLKSIKSFSSKLPGKSVSDIMPRGAGRTFPLDALYEIDRTHELQATVLTEAMREQGFIAAVAMWSQNAPEPLICASCNAADIDDLVLIIRFLQFYYGMNPACIVDT